MKAHFKKNKLSCNIKNDRGQVAFFIALIFQVLFLFFAMIINVGLLVHHKINLQNSVDLAAYYGAMRQAEVMNAIGHVNYQIRQSWKLLAWRYRQVGTAGDFSVHPFQKDLTTFKMPVTEDYPPAHSNFYDAPSFCATYVPFQEMPQDENTCKDLLNLSGVQLWGDVPIIAGFQNFTHAFADASEKLRTDAIHRCYYFGSFNYKMLAQYSYAFNLDQFERNELIKYLSQNLSINSLDLEGESIEEGVKVTLKKNLTYTNLEGLDENKDIHFFNSLSDGKCGEIPGDPKTSPPFWLSKIRIYPAFNYVDAECSKERIQPIGRPLNNQPGTAANHGGLPTSYQQNNDIGSLRADIDFLKEYVGFPSDPSSPYFFSTGVEKNPWCMSYVGVSATTRPKIPFSPFGGVVLKARGFAKPFGGRIGPWYGTNWQVGVDRSMHTDGVADTMTDPLLPPRVDEKSAGIASVMMKSKTRAANYSRFIGDKLGMKSRYALATYGRAIFALDPNWNSKIGTATTDGPALQPGAPTGEPAFSLWSHLGFDFKDPKTGGGDILSWNLKTNKIPKFRSLETAAILPDAFDLYYYSIEPDFARNYMPKIKKHVQKLGEFDKILRADLGFREGEQELKDFNIIKQYQYVYDRPDSGYPFQNLVVQQLKDANYFYPVSLDWRETLTGWAEKSLHDYAMDPQKFAKCEKSVEEGPSKEIPNSGNCLIGGRTGYGVKLISKDYLLRNDLQLGGDAGGQAGILNPPPADF